MIQIFCDLPTAAIQEASVGKLDIVKWSVDCRCDQTHRYDTYVKITLNFPVSLRMYQCNNAVSLALNADFFRCWNLDPYICFKSAELYCMGNHGYCV